MINNQAVINAAVSIISGIDPDGESHLETFVAAIVNAVLNEIKANAEIKVDNQGGNCTYSGVHPPVHSEGKIF